MTRNGMLNLQVQTQSTTKFTSLKPGAGGRKSVTVAMYHALPTDSAANVRAGLKVGLII